jgi:translation initiation factor 1
MDLRDLLSNLFPDHEVFEDKKEPAIAHELYIQKEPLICKYERRKGKPVTIIEGYDGEEEDFKIIAKEIKTKLSVGGSFKEGTILIQGDYRDKIMAFLQAKGFTVKRVGG